VTPGLGAERSGTWAGISAFKEPITDSDEINPQTLTHALSQDSEFQGMSAHERSDDIRKVVSEVPSYEKLVAYYREHSATVMSTVQLYTSMSAYS